MIKEKQIIGYHFSDEGSETFFSYNPATAVKNEFVFPKATADEVERAADTAASAFQVYYKKSGIEKAAVKPVYLQHALKVKEAAQ